MGQEEGEENGGMRGKRQGEMKEEGSSVRLAC